MSNIQRVTITLPSDLLAQVREMSQGNLSQFVGTVLHNHIEQERLRKLRDDLIAACIAKAEEDLETAEASRYAEDEAVARYVPPYVEDDTGDRDTPAFTEQEQ
jgi:metal-responsive CopG/Arc/MetJ family transcriptional regulator